MICAFEGCEEEATERIAITATLSGGWNKSRHIPWARPNVLDEQKLEVPLCKPHYEYLIHDAIRGVSLTET